MKPGLFFVTGAIALIVSQSALASRCKADVEVKRFWEEKGGFVQKASLRIKVESARPGAMVNVHVDARFHYTRSDGWSNVGTTNSSHTINTDNTSAEDLVIDTRSSNCSEKKTCKINDVEITDVSCFD